MAKSIKHKSRRMSTALLVPEAQQRRSRPVVRRRGATFRQQWKINQPLSLNDVVQLVDRASESDPGQWSALCPAHSDSNPSLSFSENDGKLLLCCHSGCSHKEILAKLKALQAEKSCCGPPSARPAPPRVTAEPTSRETKKSRNTRRELPNPTTLKNGSSAKEDFARLAMAFEQAISDVQVSQLAGELNVSPKALRAMHVGRRAQAGKADLYTFPEFDARGRVVGISTRAKDGRKACIKGSRRGLYLPVGWSKFGTPIVICEGASDTAALLTMEIAGIGRPAAKAGVSDLLKLLRRVSAEIEIFVLGENDQKADGRWPGRDGARSVASKLADGLSRSISVVLPPKQVKDVRAWIGSRIRKPHSTRGGRNAR